MATESLVADAILSGSVAGDTTGNWSGPLDGAFTDNPTTGGSWTARFSMTAPVGNQANGTHTVATRVRKISGQSGTPTVDSVSLYHNGTLIQTQTVSVPNVTFLGAGADKTVTFAASQFAGLDLADVEFEVVTSAAGGSPSSKTPVQIDSVTWSGDFTTAAAVVKSGSGSGSWAFATSASGAVGRSGSSATDWSWTGSASGQHPTLAPAGGAATGSWAYTGSAEGETAHSGATDGAWGFAGAATGSAPVVGLNGGTGAGAWSWAGAAEGAAPGIAQNGGEGASMWFWTGAATGAAPTEDASRGTASGGWSWTGAATGEQHPAGTAALAWAFAAEATGSADHKGSTTGAWTLAGTAAGPSPAYVPAVEALATCIVRNSIATTI
jgi:hypothetical protein